MNEVMRGTADQVSISAETVPSSNHLPSDLSAGVLIKAAREDAGLHIAALAAALKVPVRKLEALEANRWDELTDTTFARALASSVARHLKMDVVSVLAGVPSGNAAPLHISGGLGKAPSTHSPGVWSSKSRLGWVVGALLVTALLLYFWPQYGSFLVQSLNQPLGGVGPSNPSPSTEAAQVIVPGANETTKENTTASDVVLLSAPSFTTTPSTVPVVSDTSSPTSTIPPVNPVLVLQVKAVQDTWLEVTDGTTRARIQRLVKAGENIDFSDPGPYSVVIGNALGVQVLVRGQPLELNSLTRNNIARFDVK